MAALAAVGVIVALGPMFVSESVIRWVALEQGRASLESMAETMIGHADFILDNASDALAGLSRGGVDACSAESTGFIIDALIAHPPLKEIGVYSPDGRVICSNFGPADLQLDLANAASVAGGAFELAMIPTRVPGRAGLGMVRQAEDGQGGLAVIIEASSVLAEMLYGDMGARGHARIELAGGIEIAGSGRTRAEVAQDDTGMIEITRASARFPLMAAIAVPRAALVAPFAQLTGYAKVGGGAIGVALLIFIGAAIRARPTLEADIDAAIEGHEFVPYYQPIVDSAEGRVAGCEVLLRWIKRDGQVVAPDVFIPFAEASGQIVPITRALMKQVAADLDGVCAGRGNFRISINLVAEHFTTAGLVGDVRKAFTGGNVTPDRLGFEITERRPLRDMGTARKVIGELQALGCEVSLDDAGTGHGGLAYIHELGMDAIKIDRMFIGAIGQDAAKAPIVDALIELGRELGMKVVAEGVETEEQFGYLKSRGARYFQGFLFARPMPAASFTRFVRAFAPAPKPAATVTSIDDAPAVARAA